MEFQNKQTTPAASRPVTIGWINGEPFQLRPAGATPGVKSPPEQALTNLRIEDSPPGDHTPAARARKAKRRLRRLFEHARRNAMGRPRLCRSDEYDILRCAYRAVRAWRSDGVHDEIERELRAGAAVALSRQSNLFLVLIRCALPCLEIRRGSKWAAALGCADQQGIRSKRLSAFLWRVGGVEGAARARAKSKREMTVRDKCHARSPNAV
jgi:hypothetical protein